jgi:hypothetical protein
LQLTWVPFLLVFFGGLSYHIATALMSHLIGYNMVRSHLFVQGGCRREASADSTATSPTPPQAWSATEKDVKESTIFEELPRILKRFWGMLTIMFAIMAGIAILSLAPFVPFEYRVTDPTIQIPLLTVCVPHVLFIFVLNRESLF